MAPQDPPQLRSITPSDFSVKSFDYLIVGGGTAGLVIASRLSAIPTITVGVLEAGPKNFTDPVITVPGRMGEAIGGEYDWQFKTVPQPRLNDRSLPWARGKALGGSSAINFMCWTRPNRDDLDAWEELGNEGWGWDEMLPYFKKTETLHESSPEHQLTHQSYTTAGHHGTDGPVATIYSKEYATPHKHWHSTLNALGLETNKSHFGGSNVGVFTTLTSVDPKTRTRVSATTAYLLPHAGRDNLHVLTDATVQRVEMEKKNGEWAAVGAQYVCSGEKFVAKAAKEVIICAGSIQSPQILELSGVGNPVVLEAADVQVKVANPNVGENLQDHPMTTMVYEVASDLIGPDEVRANPDLLEAAEHSFSSSQSGPFSILPCSLSYASLVQVIPHSVLDPLLARLSKPSNPRDAVLAKQFANPKRGQVEYIFDLGNWASGFTGEPGKVYGTTLMMLQLPLSKGSIHISSKSAQDKPIIDPKYFQGPGGGELDFDFIKEAQKFGDKIARTAPLSNIVQKRVFPPERVSGPNAVSGEEGDEDFTDWLHAHITTDWHPIGTCAMGGSLGSEVGVVDARLKVYGVKGLRVADASIFPLHICAHPQALIYAIGEKAADMILQDATV